MTSPGTSGHIEACVCCGVPLCTATTGHLVAASEMKSPDLGGHWSGRL